MLSSLPLAFSAPLVLAALALLPALWLILRVTPPRPKRIDFPPLKIMADLVAKRELPAHTPWWLLALRMAVAALAILAVAGPVWNPPREAGPLSGPMLLLIDNGFGAGPDWPERLAIAESRVAAAAREGRPVALLGLAEAPAAIALSEPRAALERLRAFALQPHAPDRSAHLARIETFLAGAPDSEIVWVADGLSIGSDESAFLARLKQVADAGRLSIHTSPADQLALTNPENLAGALTVTVLRPTPSAAATGQVRALDLKGLPLGDAPFIFEGSALATSARLTLPIEVRNAVSRLEIIGERSSAAVALLDDRAKRRRVGIVSGATTDTAQPLLSPTYYVSRALQPFAEIREPRPGSTDPVGELLAQNLSVLVLADIGALDRDTAGKIDAFIARGGVLLRFAGARLAAASDDLTPVRLRRGGRTLGGGLSWETPRKLAPFTRESPFFGTQINDDVRVSRQILAEPEADLARKTWAALEDGTPVVTGERRGDGMIAMMHVTADTTWSNLPLSGLFVEMLRKIVGLAGTGPAAEVQGEDARVETLSPTRVLDGRGAFRAPPATAQPVARTFAGRATLAHPPGIYGPADASLAVNALNPTDTLSAIDLAALGAPILPVDKPIALDIRPQLLVAALLLLVADTLATLWLGGRLNVARMRRRAAPAAILLAVGLALGLAPDMARAQATPPAPDQKPPIPRELFAAGAVTRLAYVVTGDSNVDAMSKAGMAGLNIVLGARTALEPGDAVGVNAERDELAFFPVLYWPIVAGRPIPAAETLRKLEAYMKGGGLVIFDTRDAMSARPGGGTTPEGEQLRRMLQTLDIPELEPMPRDHVLTKTFYILDSFVGRYDTGTTWVEILPPAGEDGRRPARAGDNVSPIVITSNDLASAWAVGRRGEAMVPLSGSDPRQREMALRAGVNLVMYALTGNYKADQVHVPALLERLGQ
jgi:hypothetical protein